MSQHKNSNEEAPGTGPSGPDQELNKRSFPRLRKFIESHPVFALLAFLGVGSFIFSLIVALVSEPIWCSIAKPGTNIPDKFRDVLRLPDRCPPGDGTAYNDNFRYPPEGPGYAYLAPIIDHVESSTDPPVSVRWEGEEPQRLIYCRDFEERAVAARDMLEVFATQFEGCFQVGEPDARGHVTLTLGDASRRPQEDGTATYFCGCNDEQIDAVAAN